MIKLLAKNEILVQCDIDGMKSKKNPQRDKSHCCVKIVQKARQDELSWRQQLALYFTKTYCHGGIFLYFFVDK